MNLASAKPLIAQALQVKRSARQGGGKREMAEAREAYALILAALGAVNRWAGVKWTNARDDKGQPIAIAVISNAQFADSNGKTTLENLTGPNEQK